jgi:hypothetical protein
VPRLAVAWIALFAVYGLGLVVPAAPDRALTSAEAHRLLVAHSLVTDGDIDLLDDYQAGAWRSWGGVQGTGPRDVLRPTVALQLVRPDGEDGRAVPQPTAPGGFLEPSSMGLGALLAPPYWLGRAIGGADSAGGRIAAQLWCAGLLALAFALAIPIARRIVPDPWATWGVLAMALSPPAVLGATEIAAGAPAAALLTGAVAAALAVREQPRTGAALTCALLCALLWWIWLPLAPVALLVAAALARWMRRRRRGLTGFVALELLLLSAFVFLTVHDRIYGGPTPWAPAAGWTLPTDVDGPGDALARLATGPLGWLVDARYGLLRWAPIAALGGVAGWRLWRARRSRLARLFADEIHVEVIVAFLLLVVLAVAVPYSVLSPWPATSWLAGPATVVGLPVLGAAAAWAWQRVPRTGMALAALTLVATAWLLGAGLLTGDVGVAPPTGPLPWGGIERALPVLGQ